MAIMTRLQTHRRAWFWIISFGLLLGVIVTLGTSRVQAQTESPLSFEIDIGFDGYVRSSTWAPVRIIAANTGPDVVGALRVRADYPGATYAQELSLPTQSQKSVTLFIPTHGSEIVVEFVSNGDVLHQSVHNLRNLSLSGYMVGVVSPQPDLLNFLAGLQTQQSREQVTVAHLDLDQLPGQAEGLSALEALVINGVDTSNLTVEQQLALRNWVQRGGHLIVGGGPDSVLTAAGLQDLLPVRQLRVESLSELRGLARFGDEAIPDQGPYVVGVPAAVLGTTVVQEDGLPLLVQQVLGAGKVSYFGLDLSLAPMNGWAGNDAFWESLLAPLVSAPPFYARYNATQRINDTLANIDVAGLPSPFFFLTYLCSYLLFLVPINYLVLRRLGRMEWAWITIPALIFLFSLVGYIAGFRSRGGSVILRQISVIQQHSGAGQAVVDSFVGVYSPTRDQYTIRFAEPVLAQPTQGSSGFSGVRDSASAPTTVIYGPRTEFQNLWTDVGSMSMLVAHTQAPPQDVAIDLRVEQAGNQRFVRGQITNQTGAPLTEAMILVGDYGLRLDELPVGTTEVAELLTSLNTQSYSDQSLWGEYYYQLDDPQVISHDQLVRSIFWPENTTGPNLSILQLSQIDSLAVIARQEGTPAEAEIEVLTRRIRPDGFSLLIVRTPLKVFELEQGRRP